MKALGFVSGILGGLTGLFMFVGIQGGRGIGGLISGILIILLFFSFSVGGFSCLSFKNWARILLLISSALIFILILVSTEWAIISKGTNNWNVVSWVMTALGCILPICNLVVFTRSKVKEQFKQS